MLNHPTPSRGVFVAVAFVAVAGLVGCSSSPAAKRDAEVRGNVTPELETLSQRPIDVSNTQTVVWDENLRMANEDWDRLWLLDRPSRLSHWRMPH
jgi:hypothetical protein